MKGGQVAVSECKAGEVGCRDERGERTERVSAANDDTRLEMLGVKEYEQGVYPAKQQRIGGCAVQWYMQREGQRVSARCSLNG
jgi:hypothetical protein